jgi:hypothetical protein
MRTKRMTSKVAWEVGWGDREARLRFSCALRAPACLFVFVFVSVLVAARWGFACGSLASRRASCRKSGFLRPGDPASDSPATRMGRLGVKVLVGPPW